MNLPTSINTFETLRNRLLNDMLLAFAIAGIPGVGMSVWRSVTLGFQGFMFVQIMIVGVVWLLWLFRGRIPYSIRSAAIITMLGVLTFAALSRLGPVADSKVFMVIFAFASMLFFTARVAWILIAGIIICLIIFAYAATQRWLQFDIDYDTYAHHPLSWAITVWVMGLYSTIIAYVGWRMIQGLRLETVKSQELADRLQRIAERVPGMVYQYRLRPDGSSCFPYSSEAIRDIYRVSPEQVRDDASAVFAILHPDDKEKISQTIQESAKSLKPWQLEYRVLFPDGTLRWLLGSSQPQKEDDGSVLWHGFITDITERKTLEQIKNDFVSTVSHELRTPLTSIRGSISIINSGVVDDLPDERKKMLAIAEQNTERLLFLINDLLDIEKLEKGSIGLSKSRFNIQDLIGESIVQNQAYALQHGTEIILRDCDNVNVFGDSHRMKQVMANLLSNACKFSPTGEPVEVSVKKQNDHVLIEVTDHGPGIPVDFHKKIFEKFTQADSSPTRKVSGTGLGLAIVKKIVELHKGDVYFTTQENVGTSFFVKIPV